MSIFKFRPTFCVSLFLLLLLCLSSFIPQIAKFCLLIFSFAIFLLFTLVFLLFLRTKFWMLKTSILLFLCTAILLPGYLYDKSDDRIEPYVNNTAAVTLTVQEITHQTDAYFYAKAILTEIDGKSVRIKVNVSSSGTASVGDVLEGDADVAVLSSADSSGDAYQIARGYRYKLTLDDPAITEQRLTPTVLAAKWRAKLCSRISKNVSEQSGALLCGLLLGERNSLSGAFNRDMQRIGISHMLALSGMHLTVFAMGTERLLALVRVNKRYRYAFLILFTVFYLFLTGFCVSAIRAGIMLILMALTFFLGKEHDGLTALAVSVLLICMVEPFAVRDVSLWLSAFATFGILLVAQPVKQQSESKPRSLLRMIGKSISVTLCMTLGATVATLPIITFTFGKLPLLSLVANLAFSAWMQVLMYLAFLLLLLGWFPPFAALATFLSEGLIAAASFFSRIPHTQLALNQPFVRTVLLGMTVLFFVLYAIFPSYRRRGRAAFAIFLSAVLLVGGFHTAKAFFLRDSLTVYYTATETQNGDIFVLSENGCTTVIDGTRTRKQECRQVFEELAANGFYEVDHYIFTSYSSSLSATAKDTFEDQMIHRIYLPTPKTDDEESIRESVTAIAKENRIKVFYYNRDVPVTVGNSTFCLHAHDSMQSSEKYMHFSVIYGEYRLEYLSPHMLTDGNRQSLSKRVADADVVFFGCYGIGKFRFLWDDLRDFTQVPVYAVATEHLPFDKYGSIRLGEEYAWRWYDR